jgi:hypothetical protein
MRERDLTFHIGNPESEELISDAISEFVMGMLEDGIVAEYGREQMKEALRRIKERDSSKITVKH